MRHVLLATLTVLALALAGCVSVPVQGMSNARQAVQAAQQAGAERYAPALYAESRRWLDDASFAIKAQDYARARKSARQAAELARQATVKARAAQAAAPVPASAPAPATGPR